MCIDWRDEKAMKKIVYRIPQVFPHMLEGFPENIGHSLDLDLKKNGMLNSLTNQMVRGTESLNEWRLHLEQEDILYSEERVP